MNPRSHLASQISDRHQCLVLYGDSPWDTKVVGRRVAVIKHVRRRTAPKMCFDDLVGKVIRHAPVVHRLFDVQS